MANSFALELFGPPPPKKEVPAAKKPDIKVPNRAGTIGINPQKAQSKPAFSFFGGGSSASTPNVVRITPDGKATNTTPLGEPLSDLGAVVIGGKAYIVGGYTGTQFATAIIEYPSLRVVARLPQGTRYAGVAAIGRTIYVAGGLTTAGPTANIYAVTLGGKPRLIGKLPAPEDHAALAALSGTLYYVGGRKILAINPKTGRVTVAIHLPKSLSDATATSDGTQITIVGGGTKGIWLFTP